MNRGKTTPWRQIIKWNILPWECFVREALRLPKTIKAPATALGGSPELDGKTCHRRRHSFDWNCAGSFLPEREKPSRPIANCEPCMGHYWLARQDAPIGTIASMEVTKPFMTFLTGFEGISCLKGIWCLVLYIWQKVCGVVAEPSEETDVVVLLSRHIKLYSRYLCP